MSGFRGRGAGRSAYSAQPKGLFVNGAWHCDCNPRLPAIHFQVKKDGANKGRWFYSCQKVQGDPDRCKFFLWDDAARPREASALANNSRTEPGRANDVTPSKPPRGSSPPPPYTPEVPPESARKRRRPTVEDEDDEFAFDQGDPTFNNELEQVLEAAETPRKSARTEAYTTPGRRRLPWAKDEPPHGLQTPQTDHRPADGPFATRFSAPGGSLLTPSRFRQSEDDTRQTLTPSSSPFDTPTPSRFKDIGPISTGDDLGQDVFSLLRGANVNLSTQTEGDLRNLLSRHTRSAEGVRKGRELARLSVKAKDAKITELTHRVNTLEAELEAEKGMVNLMKWEAENGHQSNS